MSATNCFLTPILLVMLAMCPFFLCLCPEFLGSLANFFAVAKSEDEMDAPVFQPQSTAGETPKRTTPTNASENALEPKGLFGYFSLPSFVARFVKYGIDRYSLLNEAHRFANVYNFLQER